MVVFQSMRLATIGAVIGVASALALTKLISSILFGVKARDPLVFVTIPLVLVCGLTICRLASRPAQHPHRPG